MNRQGERRKDYGSPRTRMVQVETEGNLCGSIDVKTDNDGVNIKGQGVATPGTYEKDGKDKNYNDFSDSFWGDI